MRYQTNPTFAKGCLWGTAISLLLWGAIVWIVMH
ncbi:hypothetical protein QE450_004549 [Paenibacillus sp. SORGH_AS306]|nr:hypothetical protein [Paenibacillus sp. SORGH_AS_0306]MDR6109410.1 hypothetical protein [Paenibacillus sp. SORGH_AS_0338]